MDIKKRIIVYLLVFPICAYCNQSDNLNDVWHHDMRVTAINRPSEVGKISRNLKGIKSHNNTLNKQEDETEDSSECSFEGQRLRVVVSPQPPFVDCLQDLHGDWLCNGSNIELIHVLEHRLDFKASWIVLANNHQDDDLTDIPWIRASGASGTNPTQTQMSAVVALVATGQAMLSANGFMRTIDRSALNLLVSEPFDIFRLHLLLSKSVRQHDHIFIKPFHPNAWIAILSSAILVVPVFYLINTTSAYYALEDDELLKMISPAECYDYYRRKIVRMMPANPFKRNRKVSLSQSDLSFDKELNRMMMNGQAANVRPFSTFKAKSDIEPTGFDLRARSTTTSGSALALRMISERAGPLNSLPTSKSNRKLARRLWAADRKRIRKQARRKRRSGFFNVAYVAWYAAASLSNQGGETEDLPRADSTRILIAFWWLYLIVICAIHSGILTAILTFPKQHDFIDDYLNLKPSELVDLHLSVDKQGELAHLLANSDNLHKSSLQLLKEHDVPVSYVNFRRNRQRILDSIQMGQTALMEEISTLKQIITREYLESKQTKCLFKSSRYPIDVIPMSLVISDKMPPNCMRLINATLARVMQSGLARKWRRKFESAGNNCLNSVVINAGDVDKVELKHIVLAFWLLAGGAAIGFLFLLSEIAWLFTFGDEDEDDNVSRISSNGHSLSSLSITSSDSSTSSDESDQIRLGFRRALMAPDYQLSAIRSLKARHMQVDALIRKTKKNHKRRLGKGRHQKLAPPQIILTLDLEQDSSDIRSEDSERHVVINETDGLKEVGDFYARRLQEKRYRRAAKEAERRARRVRKTVELLKRVHGGHIYSDRLKKRMRRLSHSLVGQLATTTLPQISSAATPNEVLQATRRRKQ